jgi:hypothetical protein
MEMGAMTGRKAGYCSGNFPGFGNAGVGRGFGMGAGRGGWWRRNAGGRGWRNRFNATGLPGWQRVGPVAASAEYTADAPADKQSLKERYQALQAELDAIKKRLDDFE